MAHTTRYGNTYSDEDWEEIKAGYAEEAAREKVVTDKIDGMEKYLCRRLNDLGLDANQIRTIIRLFKYDEFEEANIQFSSKDRQEKITNLWNRWNAAINKLEI